MAILPTTQDVTQFLGSSTGKPVNFNPAQQSPMSNGQPMANAQQNMPAAPSPYMPSSGPYNPYMSQWKQLMGGPSGQPPMQQGRPGMMTRPPMMGAPTPQMSGMSGPMPPPQGNPGMMGGMFSHMPMVR